MNTPDHQILLLIEILKELGVIKYGTEFCEAIGLRKQNLTKIKNGDNHFTPEHIEKIVKKYKVNANWIFGVGDEVWNDPSKNSKSSSDKSDIIHHSHS